MPSKKGFMEVAAFKLGFEGQGDSEPMRMERRTRTGLEEEVDGTVWTCLIC